MEFCAQVFYTQEYPENLLNAHTHCGLFFIYEVPFLNYYLPMWYKLCSNSVERERFLTGG